MDEKDLEEIQEILVRQRQTRDEIDIQIQDLKELMREWSSRIEASEDKTFIYGGEFKKEWDKRYYKIIELHRNVKSSFYQYQLVLLGYDPTSHIYRIKNGKPNPGEEPLLPPGTTIDDLVKDTFWTRLKKRMKQ